MFKKLQSISKNRGDRLIGWQPMLLTFVLTVSAHILAMKIISHYSLGIDLLSYYDWAVVMIMIYLIVKFLVPMIIHDTPSYRRSYTRNVPVYLWFIASLLVIGILRKVEQWELGLFFIMLVGWIIIFFDYRYFACGALVMVVVMIVHLLFDEQTKAEVVAIVLYYYLIATMIT